MSEEAKSPSGDFTVLLQGLAIEEAFYNENRRLPYLVKRDMGAVNFLSITSNNYIYIDHNAVPNIRALYTFICVYDDFTEKNKENLEEQQHLAEKIGMLVEFVIVDLKSRTYKNLFTGKMTDKKLNKVLEKALKIYFNTNEDVIELAQAATERAAAKKEELRDPARLYIFSPVIILVIINIVIFFAGSEDFVLWGILDSAKVRQGEIWRLFTAMFLHADMAHLFGNMYFLTMLGRVLVNKYSNGKLLFVYLASGVAGCVLSATFSGGASLGASGAIMGLGGVLLCKLLFDKNRKYLRQKNSYIHLGFMVIFNLAYGLFTTGIDNFGHFGGFICGFLLELLFMHIKSGKQA
ncbi:MAG: rhomboid family intramembrane serine protease [Ruminococcaceae bacterium]|nr:rhomboid family intramembrane serine protease [Oscillospiraceae bacterium]